MLFIPCIPFIQAEKGSTRASKLAPFFTALDLVSARLLYKVQAPQTGITGPSLVGAFGVN